MIEIFGGHPKKDEYSSRTESVAIASPSPCLGYQCRSAHVLKKKDVKTSMPGAQYMYGHFFEPCDPIGYPLMRCWGFQVASLNEKSIEKAPDT